MTKRYAYKGTNQDTETCEVCGKTDLQKVMWLIELDQDGNEAGEAFATGTTCGAKLLGYTQSSFVKATKEAQRSIEQQRYWAYHNHPLMKEANKIREKLQRTLSGRKLRSHPDFIKTKEMMRQAHNEAYGQKYKVEI